jgi:ribosome-binding protein aMBF1 (putative translation factor)
MCCSGYRRAVVAVAYAATRLDDSRLRPTPDHDLAEPLSRFAANLRRARLRAALSQEALAAEADMHRTALSRLETCERAPEFRTLLRLARALNVTPASLLRGIR